MRRIENLPAPVKPVPFPNPLRLCFAAAREASGNRAFSAALPPSWLIVDFLTPASAGGYILLPLRGYLPRHSPTLSTLGYLHPCHASKMPTSKTSRGIPLVRSQAFFQPSQAHVRQYGQRCCRNRTGEDDLIVDPRKTTKNVFAQTAGTDGRSDGGEADRNHSGYTHAGDDYAQR